MVDHLRRWPAFGLLVLAMLTGCTARQNPQDLKEKTAQTMAEIKRDAKAVAAGIREGWNRDKPVDLNTAKKEQLLTLPALTPTEADCIIAERPYSEPQKRSTTRFLIGSGLRHKALLLMSAWDRAIIPSVALTSCCHEKSSLGLSRFPVRPKCLLQRSGRFQTHRRNSLLEGRIRKPLGFHFL